MYEQKAFERFSFVSLVAKIGIRLKLTLEIRLYTRSFLPYGFRVPKS